MQLNSGAGHTIHLSSEIPSTTTPVTAGLATAFALSIVGMLLVIWSRNVAIKRVVLPVTLFVFSAMAYVLVRDSGAASRWPAFIVPSVLVLNAAWVWRVTRYCERCGRTVQAPLMHKGPLICSSCGAG